jgi:hypothetical protein
MHSFQLTCFFLQCDGYALATEASSPQTFVKTEPLSPKTDDYNFAYASDTAGNSGRNLSNFLSEILALWKLCNLILLKFLNGIRQ